MDSIRATILLMKNTETGLLSQRTARFNSLSRLTPLIILIASVLAILIAIIFFIRVRKDIDEKTRMQQELENKDRDMSRRIDIIRQIAGTVAAGDYSVRINDLEKDDLGSLSNSLNTMAVSLEQSFKDISEKEWLQTGAARLSEILMGEHPIWELAHKALEEMVNYTGSSVGAFYFASDRETLDFSAGYAFDPAVNRKQIRFGQGIAGECAQSKKVIEITDVSKGDLQVSYATGNIMPSGILAFPILFEQKLLAAVELGNVNAFTFGYRWYPIMFSRAGLAMVGELSFTKTTGTMPLSGTGVGLDPLSPTTAVNGTSVLLALDFDF